MTAEQPMCRTPGSQPRVSLTFGWLGPALCFPLPPSSVPHQRVEQQLEGRVRLHPVLRSETE